MDHFLSPLQTKYKVRIRHNGLSSFNKSKQPTTLESLYDLCLNGDLKTYGQKMHEFDDIIHVRDGQIQGYVVF